MSCHLPILQPRTTLSSSLSPIVYEFRKGRHVFARSHIKWVIIILNSGKNVTYTQMLVLLCGVGMGERNQFESGNGFWLMFSNYLAVLNIEGLSCLVVRKRGNHWTSGDPSSLESLAMLFLIELNETSNKEPFSTLK